MIGNIDFWSSLWADRCYCQPTTYVYLEAGSFGYVGLIFFHGAARVGAVAYHLELPNQYKFHNVFYVSLLNGFNDSKADRVEVNPAPVFLESGSYQEFKVECIMEYQHVDQNRPL